MNRIKRLLKYFFIPYKHTLLIHHKNGHKYYCERTAHAFFEKNHSEYLHPRFRGGKYKITEGVWNLFPDDGNIGLIPYKDIANWEIISTKEQFDAYRCYRLDYYKNHRQELYLPECRSSLTNDFLEYLNSPRVQEMIRNWVDGYGYSDAYNWENPEILIEHIWKDAARMYGGEKVKKLEEPGKN